MENEVEVVPERDGKTSSVKRVEEYKINKGSQQFKNMKKDSIEEGCCESDNRSCGCIRG
jgi:hypothetical protein